MLDYIQGCRIFQEMRFNILFGKMYGASHIFAVDEFSILILNVQDLLFTVYSIPKNWMSPFVYELME